MRPNCMLRLLFYGAHSERWLTENLVEVGKFSVINEGSVLSVELFPLGGTVTPDSENDTYGNANNNVS